MKLPNKPIIALVVDDSQPSRQSSHASTRFGWERKDGVIVRLSKWTELRRFGTLKKTNRIDAMVEHSGGYPVKKIYSIHEHAQKTQESQNYGI